MRIVAIIVVLAIVYLVYGRNGETQSLPARVAEAQQESALVQPAPKGGAPAAASGSLRAPIDRARQAIEMAKERHTE